MGNTKKVGSAGRYGSRYGVGIRRRLLKVERKQKQKNSCSVCGYARVKRTAAGLYTCTKCGNTFAGGAYTPETMTGGLVRKIITQKAFGEQSVAEFSAAREAREQARVSARKEEKTGNEEKSGVGEKSRKMDKIGNEKKQGIVSEGDA